MKNIFKLLFLGLLVFSCGKETKEANKIVVTFYLPGDTLPDNYSVTLEDAESVSILKKITEGEKSEEYKCGYTGKIILMNGEETLHEGEFNLDKDCRHIAFMQDDKLMTAKINDKALELLNQQLLAARKQQLEKLKWFVGIWSMEGPQGFMREEWVVGPDQNFSGTAYEFKGKDTTFAEKLSMVCEQEAIYYIPEIKKQGPVRFKLTRMTPTFVLFENPDHDFPKKISYEAIGDSGLVAHIQGPAEDGSNVTMDFPYRKVK